MRKSLLIAPIYIVGKISRFLQFCKAHRENDKAVMAAYGFKKDMTEAEIVGELFKMYEKLTSEGKQN